MLLVQRKKPEEAETVMKVCWMFVILLYYMSSYTAQCLSPNSSNEETKTYCVPRRGHMFVFVPCPIEQGDVTFKLFKNQDSIWSFQQTSLRALDPQLQINKEDNLIGFNINGTSNTTYKCEATIAYPPPLLKRYGPKIQVLAEGENCTCDPTCNTKQNSTNEEVIQRTQWIWISVVVLLSTCNLTVTIVASVLWFKLKGADSQSDYMNTKPIAPRNRKKKKTVQNPAPRYF